MTRARDIANFGDGIDATDLSSGAVEGAMVTPSGRRNLIINGAMQVAQRGTSTTGFTSSFTYKNIDRWMYHGSGATIDCSQQSLSIGQTDIPSQFKYFLRFNPTTGANFAGVGHRIEDVTVVSGEDVTVSFYAKGTNPAGGSVAIRLRQHFGTGGTVESVDLYQSITLTSSWQRFTKTFSVPSLSGKTIGTSSYIELFIHQPEADNSSDAWTLDITGVQLEVGSVATPFEHRSYGEELALCQRYFYAHTSTSQEWIYNEYASVAAAKFWQINLLNNMRATPTFTGVPSGVIGSGVNYLSGTITNVTAELIRLGRASMRVTMSTGSGTSNTIVHTDSFGGKVWKFDAEL